MSFEDLIIHYGYLALFVGTFLEGETILVIAGYLAQHGFLDLPFVILTACFGSFSGDQSFFFLGHYKGLGYLTRNTAWRSKVERAFALLHRHQIAVILGFRFIYGIRNATPFVIGASGVPPLRFVPLNFLGAGVWAAVFGTVGYSLGSFVDLALKSVKRYEMIGLGILCCVALAYFLWSNMRKK